MKILIILTSFNTLILIGFVVLIGGALFFDYKQKAQKILKNNKNKKG